MKKVLVYDLAVLDENREIEYFKQFGIPSYAQADKINDLYYDGKCSIIERETEVFDMDTFVTENCDTVLYG